MISNLVIGLGLYMSFGTPTLGWGALLAVALVADVFHALTKTLKVQVPVIGLADMGATSEALKSTFKHTGDEHPKSGYL